MQNKAIAVIRHSLAAAGAALDLLEHVENVPAATPAVTVTSTVVEAVPAIVEAPAVDEVTLADLLEAELLGSTYDLRTTSELGTKFGVTSAQIRNALTDAGISFVIKHRRSDGAELIGLSHRN